jgi:two-component system CheB/CheR fusion protein
MTCPAEPPKSDPQSHDPAARAARAFPIMAIGMSAGGLEAATEFLSAAPADTGMALVIVPAKTLLIEDGVLRGFNPELTVAGQDSASVDEALRATNEKLRSLDEELTAVISQLGRKVGELEEAEKARQTAEAIVETVRDPLILLDPDLRVRSANAAFHRLFGSAAAESVGRPIFELAQGRWDIPELRLGLESLIPEGRQIDDFEVALETPMLGRRNLVLTARRIGGPGERSELILLAIEDVTARRISSRHQDILVTELSHRVKNTLTVVQSIAAQTLKGSPSIEAFNEAFLGRLQALSGAHDMIIEGSWNGVEVRSIIERALRPFQLEDRVAVSQGPGLELHPQATLALAMILHELATNAVKHGALSASAGRVAVAWRIRDNAAAEGRTLVLDWIETDGPAVTPPSRRGFGVRFVERSVAYELGGAASLDFDRAGLRAFLEIPLAAAVMPADRAPDQADDD